MIELTPPQLELIERCLQAGFRPISIPLYESALALAKNNCAAVLSVSNGQLKLITPGSYLLDGNLSVLLQKPAGQMFVWKKTEVAATPERLAELQAFRRELSEILSLASTQ